MRKDIDTYTILVLEDNPGDQLLITDYLEEEIVAPEIHHAENLKAGANQLAQHHESIDIILLDLSLPDEEGESLLAKMLELAKDIPIIILTGYTDVTFAKKSLSIGASDYLLKDNLNSTVLYKSIVYNIERNKYLLQIKESEQRYSDLFHLSPQPMWVYDLETLYFLDVNDAAIQHYGYSFDEFLNMTIKEIRPKDEISKLEKALDISRQKEKYSFQDEFTHTKKNGQEIIVDIRSNIIYYNNRKAEVVLATDITERYQYTQAIEKQNEKLKEIAWTQSHVVRAPVARLMGIADLLKKGKLTQAEKDNLLDHISKSAEEVDEIVKEIVNKSQSIIDLESE